MASFIKEVDVCQLTKTVMAEDMLVENSDIGPKMKCLCANLVVKLREC